MRTVRRGVPVSDPDFMKVSEVAHKLNVSRHTIYGWIKQGKLQGLKIAGDAVRIPRESYETLLREAKRLHPEDTEGNTKPVPA